MIPHALLLGLEIEPTMFNVVLSDAEYGKSNDSACSFKKKVIIIVSRIALIVVIYFKKIK